MRNRRTITVILAVLAVLVLIAALISTGPRDDRTVVPADGGPQAAVGLVL